MENVKKRVRNGIIVQRIVSMSHAYALSPWVVMHNEFFTSILLLTSISIVLGLACIAVYDKTKTDWLLIESLKEAHCRNTVNELQNRITRFIIKWSKKGKGLLVVVLVLWDPAIAVLYCRSGYGLYNGIPNLKIWTLFLLSCILCAVLGVVGISGLIVGWEFVKDFILDIIKSCIAIAM